MTHTDPSIVGIKQLHQELKFISERVLQGEEFIVVKNSKPVFRIIPVEKIYRKKYTFKDFASLQFKSGDARMSRDIDKILYR